MKTLAEYLDLAAQTTPHLAGQVLGAAGDARMRDLASKTRCRAKRCHYVEIDRCVTMLLRWWPTAASAACAEIPRLGKVAATFVVSRRARSHRRERVSKQAARESFPTRKETPTESYAQLPDKFSRQKW